MALGQNSLTLASVRSSGSRSDSWLVNGIMEHEKHTSTVLFTTQHDKEIVSNVHVRGTQ